MLTKACTRCGISKSPCDFYAQKTTKDGLGSWCRECVKWLRKSKRGTATVAERPPVVAKAVKDSPALGLVIDAIKLGLVKPANVAKRLGKPRQWACKWLKRAAALGYIACHGYGVYGVTGSTPEPRAERQKAIYRENDRIERAIATALRTLPRLAYRGSCLSCGQERHAADCPVLILMGSLREQRGQFSAHESIRARSG